jgi:chorismate synthase
MLGCDLGTLFKTTVAGGSYQEGLTVHLQGVPPGLLITEEEIYQDLLLRKPGQGELTSPRREPDVPVIYNGVNAADTMPGFANEGYTNGTPFVYPHPQPRSAFRAHRAVPGDQPHTAAAMPPTPRT